MISSWDDYFHQVSWGLDKKCGFFFNGQFLNVSCFCLLRLYKQNNKYLHTVPPIVQFIYKTKLFFLLPIVQEESANEDNNKKLAENQCLDDTILPVLPRSPTLDEQKQRFIMYNLPTDPNNFMRWIWKYFFPITKIK